MVSSSYQVIHDKIANPKQGECETKYVCKHGINVDVFNRRKSFHHNHLWSTTICVVKHGNFFFFRKCDCFQFFSSLSKLQIHRAVLSLSLSPPKRKRKKMINHELLEAFLPFFLARKVTKKKMTSTRRQEIDGWMTNTSYYQGTLEDSTLITVLFRPCMLSFKFYPIRQRKKLILGKRQHASP